MGLLRILARKLKMVSCFFGGEYERTIIGIFEVKIIKNLDNSCAFLLKKGFDKFFPAAVGSIREFPAQVVIGTFILKNRCFLTI